MKAEMKREVESLAKRFPKRGIDPTIPEGVREQLMDMRRQRELDEGMRAHEGRKLAKGGMAKYAKGGVTRADGCITKGHTKGKVM